jgi:SNF2 family DNA or RNA helicase
MQSYEQAVGRVHRMGQRREVHVYRLAMIDSIDERILTVGAQRRGIAGHIKEDKVFCKMHMYNSNDNDNNDLLNPEV